MKTPPSSRSFFLLCAGAFFLAVVLVAWGSHRMGLPFLPVDDFDGVPYPRHPGVAVAETAKHFWRTGSLERPEFSQIRDWCRRQSLSDTGSRYTPDVYAVAHDGRLFPKHCWLVSVLAAPFYGLAGNAGLWLFNQAALFLLFCGMYTMARKMM